MNRNTLILFVTILNIGFIKNDYVLPPKIIYDLNDAYPIFEKYVIEYDKHYSSIDEYNNRYNIFKENLEKLNQFNLASNLTVYGLNQFSDLSDTEFSNTYMGLKFNDECEGEDVVDYVPVGNAPPSLDYRQKGYVSPIKSQGQCGSCYAFSAIGAVEGQHAKRHGNLPVLSEQQVVDCDNADNGCDGGFMENVLETLRQQGGSVREVDYPYQAAKLSCRLDPGRIAVRVTGGGKLRIKNEDDLKDALANIGPLAIGLEVGPTFKRYHGGVFNDINCAQWKYHGVLLIGYGTDAGTDFWIIKNSWGTNWGEKGIMRLLRGQFLCKIGYYVVSAEVA